MLEPDVSQIFKIIKMLLSEIYSGTGSIGRPWREAGHTVVSFDIDSRFSPEICGDILQVDYKSLPIPDVIWSSPPCEQYSTTRTVAKTPRNFALADSLAAKAWDYNVL